MADHPEPEAAPSESAAHPLRRSPERLQLALDAGHMGTWEWDLATNRVIWDEALEVIFGLPPGGFDGTYEAYAQLLHPHDRDWVLETVQRSLETRSGHAFEHRAVWPDGSVRWIEGRGRVVIEDGEPVGMIGVAVDVTDRKRAEERRNAQYEVTRVLAESRSVDEAGIRLLEALGSALRWDFGTFWHAEPEGRLRPIALWRPEMRPGTGAFDEATRVREFARGEGLPGLAWERAEPVWIRDVAELEEERFPRLAAAAAEGLHGAVAVPIVLGPTVFGVIDFLSRDVRAPDELLLRTLASIGSQIGQFIHRIAAEEAVRASEARERQQRIRADFLARASAELARSLDHSTTLSRVARLAVPRIADWCSVDVVLEDGSMSNLAVTHADPAKVALAEELRRRSPPDPQAPQGPANVVRTGEPELVEEIPDEMLQASARSEEHLELIRGLGIRSYMCVPLVARGRTFGALTFVNEEASRRFSEDDLELAVELGRRAGLALDNARLFRQRSHIAHTLQRSLLPAELPEISGLEIAARYRPAGEGMEVGGDFYDAFEIAGDHWGAVMGDVCGKGAEAAGLTALVRHTIRAVALQGAPAEDVLRHLNAAILRELGTDRFCTVAYADVQAGGTPKVRVVCAGHPLPLLVRASGEVEAVGEPGTLLGWFEALELHVVEEKLGLGEALVLYTDGVTEERREDEQFGEERLREVLSASVELSADGMAEAVERAVRDFCPQLPRDDLAILVLKHSAD